MTRHEFTVASATDMNRFNFKHLPEVIESYRRQLAAAKAPEEIERLKALINERTRLLDDYREQFPEGPL